VGTELPSTLGEYWRNELRWRRAHLSALLRSPDFFLSSPKKILSNLYIYLLAWGGALGILAWALLVLLSGGRLFPQMAALWIILAAWVLLRRAALSAEVAAYRREISWLKLIWVPPLLLAVALAAILPASLTLQRQTAHFKGPRPERARPALDQ
jgi:cellulose synthase/poly-beta-1,6-N-acetylglucosamine synthase-like glycosyltransferase